MRYTMWYTIRMVGEMVYEETTDGGIPSDILGRRYTGW